MSSDPGSPVRTVSFLLIVVGGLLAGVGTVLTWLTVHLVADQGGVLDQTYPGLDLWEGKVVLACAILLLVGALAIRVGSSAQARRLVGSLMIVVGAVIVIVTLVAAFGERSHVRDRALDDMARAAGGELAAVQRVADLGLETTVGAGVLLAIAGGVIGVVGTSLRLARKPSGKVADDPAPDGLAGDVAAG